MEKLGKYRILGKIAEGGMGVVYRARHSMLDREIALKTLELGPGGDCELRARFLQEAELIGSLSHQNVVSIYDMGEEGDRLYIAMEYLEGEDLGRKLERRESLPLEEKVRIIFEIGDGLAYAHRRGIVHRDIKPSNIFVCNTGRVKILDFGLARIGTSSLTPVGRVLGTPNYMSPEQLLGQSPDPRSDIFSLGALAFELLTHQRPFSAPTIEETLFRILKRAPEPMENIEPAIPPELAWIVRSAMAKQVVDRYQNVDQLLQDLRRFDRHLERHKRDLWNEFKQTVEKLESLLAGNPELMETGSSSARLVRLLELSRRGDLSYMALVGLRDGAGLEYRRVESLLRNRSDLAAEVASAARAELTDSVLGTLSGGVEELPASTSTRAETLFVKAKQRCAESDLAGCLTLLCEGLRLEPEHAMAAPIEEDLRARLIRVGGEADEKWREEVVAAALLTMDAGSGESAAPGGPGVDPAFIARLSQLLLSELDPGADDP